MKILLLDIERSPNIAYVWGLFKQNIAINQLAATGEILCYAAKWYGEDEIFFDSLHNHTKKQMLKGIHKLIDVADVVVHYNGTAYDMPVLNTGFVEVGLTPPSPYKNVDLLKVIRNQFKFTSNKMDHVSEKLKIGNKHRTTFELWIGCMNNDKESWMTMEQYNIEDVMILERMYEKLKPWIKNHPNHGVYADAAVCPNCGSKDITKRGFAFTNTGKFQRYCCDGCGAWFRSKTREKSDVETFRNV